MRKVQGIVASFVSSVTRFFGRSVDQASKSRTSSCLGVELLETKRLLAADLAVTSFAADGEDLIVEYDVLNESVTAFDVAVYRSSDGVTQDAELTRVRVTDTAALAQGTGHELAIDAVFTDLQEDYFLLVELDADGEITESNETNNERLFDGGVFQTSDDIVHVHGTSGSDTITLSDEGADVDVTLGGQTHTIAASDIASIHVRSHDGYDNISADATLNKPLWVFAGDDSDIVYGGAADDYIDGQGGNDYLRGGDGDDVVHGGAGGDYVFGEDGHDDLYGDDGNDSLYGGEGNDQLDAGENATYSEYLYGEAGNDTLTGGDQNDELSGGDGDDIVYGGSGDDSIHGGSGDDTLLGEDGNDSLYGGYGDDNLSGGDGADYLYGQQDADTLYGGEGNDYLDAGYYGGYGGELLYGDAGNDTLLGTDQADTLYGGQGDDTLYGGYGDDSMHGELGDDTLLGEEGNDSLYGGYGEDYIDGGNGDDFLFGEADADTMYGGYGDDTLDGGIGNDAYVYAGGQAGDVTVDRPTILNFHGTEYALNGWIFTGNIADDADPAGLVVTFDGVIPANTTTTVNPDGTFELVIIFDEPPIGIATAKFTDAEGLTSKIATFIID